jgi:hypothetical protein
VAKLRLADPEKDERKKAENPGSVASGKMFSNETLALYRERFKNDMNLKPRSREYREERTAALVKSWPELNDQDVRQVSKRDGQERARSIDIRAPRKRRAGLRVSLPARSTRSAWRSARVPRRRRSSSLPSAWSDGIQPSYH